MSLFSPPQPPSPSSAIGPAQQVSNIQQGYNTTAATGSQAGSMVSQYNPYGALTYAPTGQSGPGGVPLYASSLTMSPQQQALYDTLTGTQYRAGRTGQGILASSIPTGNVARNIGDMTSGLEGQMMAAQMGSVMPWMTLQRDQEDTKLRNMGLAPGNPAYDNAMKNLSQGQSQAMYGAAAQFEPTAYGQAEESLYKLPIATGTTLAQFGAPTSPSGSLINAPGLSIQPASMTQAYDATGRLLGQQYQGQAQQYAAMMQALGNIAGVGAGIALGPMGGGPAIAGGLKGLFSGGGSTPNYNWSNPITYGS